MDIFYPIDYKHVNLLTEQDASNFGEALRHFCFKENGRKTGCYESFELIGY